MKCKMTMALLLMISTNLAAQDSAKILNEVIVTATKSPIKQNETGKVVTVITQEQLQKNSGKTLGQVLNEQPGMIINGADNNLGTNQTVYLRGASAGNTLILIDGIPLYDASGISSEFDLNNFSLDQIERIEILKGAQSTFYGSDAVAGVINLITKKSGKKPFGISANFSAGSYETYKGGISLSGNSHGQSFFVSYNKIKSHGFSSAYDSTGRNNFEKDGFNQDVFQLNYSFTPFKKTSFRVFGKYNNNRADLDAAAFSDDKDYTNHNKNLIGGAAIDRKIKKGFIRLQYSYNHFKRNFLNDSTDVSSFSKYQNGMYDGTSHFAELYSSINFTDHIELLAGADLRRNSSSQLYIFYPDYGFPALPISADSAVTKQLSFYTSVMLKRQKGLNLELGGRFNHHNIYGTNFTYSVNPFYIFGDHYKLYGSFSSGYRVPSIYQLYSEFGNKKLRPEVTTNFEAGVQYSSKKINAKLTGFIRQTSDVFYFYTDPVTFAGKYINADRQRDFGMETEVAIQFNSRLSLSSNYSYVDGKISTRDYNGKDTSYFNLYKRPKNVFNISLNFQATKSLFLSARLKTVSKAVEPPSFQLNGYYTLSFYGQYNFKKYFSFFTDVENITNQKYFVTRGFSTKGFCFNAGAKFKW